MKANEGSQVKEVSSSKHPVNVPPIEVGARVSSLNPFDESARVEASAKATSLNPFDEVLQKPVPSLPRPSSPPIQDKQTVQRPDRNSAVIPSKTTTNSALSGQGNLPTVAATSAPEIKCKDGPELKTKDGIIIRRPSILSRPPAEKLAMVQTSPGAKINPVEAIPKPVASISSVAASKQVEEYAAKKREALERAQVLRSLREEADELPSQPSKLVLREDVVDNAAVNKSSSKLQAPRAIPLVADSSRKPRSASVVAKERKWLIVFAHLICTIFIVCIII